MLEKELVRIIMLEEPDPYTWTKKPEDARYVQFEFRGDEDKDNGFMISVDKLYELLIDNGDSFDVWR